MPLWHQAIRSTCHRATWPSGARESDVTMCHIHVVVCDSDRPEVDVRNNHVITGRLACTESNTCRHHEHFSRVLQLRHLTCVHAYELTQVRAPMMLTPVFMIAFLYAFSWSNDPLIHRFLAILWSYNLLKFSISNSFFIVDSFWLLTYYMTACFRVSIRYLSSILITHVKR